MTTVRLPDSAVRESARPLRVGILVAPRLHLVPRFAVICTQAPRISARRRGLKGTLDIDDSELSSLRCGCVARLATPWLRIQRLIRSILEARRDQGTRPVLKATLIKALGKREKIRRAGCS